MATYTYPVGVTKLFLNRERSLSFKKGRKNTKKAEITMDGLKRKKGSKAMRFLRGGRKRERLVK